MRLTIRQLRGLLREELNLLIEEEEQIRTWCNIVYYLKVAIKSLDECEHYLTLTGDHTVEGSRVRGVIRTGSSELQYSILPVMYRNVRGSCDVNDQAHLIGFKELPPEMNKSRAWEKAHVSLEAASTNLSIITLSTDKQGNQFVDQLGPVLSGKYREILKDIYEAQAYTKSNLGTKSEGYRHYW